MENRKCKGMRDFLPDDMVRFRHIEDVFRACCCKYDYREVRTPTLEYLHLFTAVGTLTPSMLGKVYSFLDWDGWSGERVVLRPDGTIPVARLYVENLSEYEQAKLFYVSNSFVFEGTGRKDRERWQCGAEFIGGVKLVADAEAISLAVEVLSRLGLSDVRLQLSHAGLVKALIRELDLGTGEEAKVTARILDGDWEALSEAKSTRDDLDRFLSPLLNLKGKSGSFLRNVRALSATASASFKSSLDDFIGIATLLDDLECDYEIDITAIRSFEYYTGVCFRLLCDGETIGGGGRYDDLITLMSGKTARACGFALYIDPIMRLLSYEGGEGSRVLIVGEQPVPETIRLCFTLAQSLRDMDCVATVDFQRRETSGYRWVVSVSGEGVPRFAVTNLERKEQRNVSSAAAVVSIVSG
jgi:histidyl-tRNA synthetase